MSDDVDIIDLYDEVGPSENLEGHTNLVGPKGLYIANPQPVRQVGSDQLTMSTFELPVMVPGLAVNPRPVRIVPKLESGIAQRITVTLMVNQGANCYVYLLPSEEAAASVSLSGTGGSAVAYLPFGYGYPNLSAAVQLLTSAELWAVAAANALVAGPVLSVLVESFYGR